jgi:hypothetical protein
MSNETLSEYDGTLKGIFTVEPEVYADQELLVDAIRSSQQSVREIGGRILSTGVYVGVPEDEGLGPEDCGLYAEAGFATIDIVYGYDNN